MITDLITNLIADVLNFFFRNLLLFQLISFFVSSILLFLSIYFLAKSDILGRDIEHYIGVFTNKDINKRRTLRAWKEIQKKLKTRKTSEIKSAIIEADRILHELLKMA